MVFIKKRLLPVIITIMIFCPYVLAEDSLLPLEHNNSNANMETSISSDFQQQSEDVQQWAKAFSPLLLNPSEVLFSTSQRSIDSIDPTFSASYFPGGRGADKLVVYTPRYGLHTGTNEFGTEAVIEDNVVTAISGADSTIPFNGIVISGHGSAKKWITQNIAVGSKVYVDEVDRKLTVYTTSESYTYEARKKIEEARLMVETCKNMYSKYNSSVPEKHIGIAQNYIKIAQDEQKEPYLLKKHAQEAIEEANMAIKTALPFVNSEMRGTWLRPTETSEKEIETTLDDIKANGFNAIFLETYFHGKTIFPSKTMNKYGFIVQNDIFEGFDPLKIWVREAHKRGIKVHIWFQSFYVGNKHPSNEESSILAVRPDWGNKTKLYANSSMPTKSTSEHNGYFLDPSNPEIHEFLLELIDEIISEYRPDGINLDYIRYPNENSKSIQGTWGYTQYARNKFIEEYEIDPIDLTTSDVHWYDWNQFRRAGVTEFVEKVGKLCDERGVYSSAVIFPDIASALSTKQQDWRTWSVNEYIDGFTPLFLTYDYHMLASMMNDVLRVKSSKTELYAGLFVTFMGGAPEDLIRQIYQTRLMRANGVIVFDWAHTTPVYRDTLMASSFNSGVKQQGILVAKSKKKRWFRRKKA